MTVAKVFRLRSLVEGDVGIEIEVEGSKLPHTDEHWTVTQDGSLRGEYPTNACEYVLQRPMSLPEANEALAYLAHRYKENKAKVADSPRCGVHVHVNCQHISLLQLYNFMVMYLIFEDVLVKWCGPTREGNLFCLRAKDAEYLLFVLGRALETKDFRRMFSTDELRYASMNVRSLCTYGSLEFRAMAGTVDMSLIYRWAEMLVGMRERAGQFENPVEMILATSEGGAEAFVRQAFSDENASLIMSIEGWEDLIVEGVRRAQEVAYAGEWEDIASFPKRTVGGLEVSPDWDSDWPTMDL